MSDELEAREVFFSYGDHQVVRNVSLMVRPGEFTAIIGPNGSGKTTLLKNLLRILNPEKGMVLLDGRDINGLSRREYARSAGSVPQNPALDYEYSVKEIVLMGRYPHLGRFQSLSPRDHEIARKAMLRADILDLQHHRITQVSGGEAQRVVIARALTQEPRILALDEPTNHLDIRHQAAILTLLKELCRDQGIAVVAILHDLNFALSYGDTVLLLQEGSVFRSGNAREVLTPEAIRAVYGVEAAITENPFTGSPHIVYRM
ncbi:ABC transporter ATP-binding protein [Marispirochaeta sp.]|uniref:ABC transporter ATP-binding protein n=1 Tax=Marispirochaeta sp. TaxID=2038653 RepID=UPI0029C680D7|nr:ABC transporter ATP-binding protein [Marispirochaeta sp.]